MRISDHWHRITISPPWYVRLLGALIMIGDVAAWLIEHASPTAFELGKHGILLAIGLACFYPEGLRLVMGYAQRLPIFARRSQTKPDAPSISKPD